MVLILAILGQVPLFLCTVRRGAETPPRGGGYVGQEKLVFQKGVQLFPAQLLVPYHTIGSTYKGGVGVGVTELKYVVL